MSHALQNGGSAALVMPLILSALLFASFPAFAAADSSGVQYENALQTATGTSPIPSHRGPLAHSSTTHGGAGAPVETSSATPASSTPSHSVSRTSDSGRLSSLGASRPTARAGSQDNSGNSIGSDQSSHHRQLNRAVSSTQPASGGSSPLGPILLVAFALAAISIGAVFLRQRRQCQSSRSSSLPKAS
jgi:cobalamin biosynthesis Mg chelatase CobN